MNLTFWETQKFYSKGVITSPGGKSIQIMDSPPFNMCVLHFLFHKSIQILSALMMRIFGRMGSHWNSPPAPSLGRCYIYSFGRWSYNQWCHRTHLIIYCCLAPAPLIHWACMLPWSLLHLHPDGGSFHRPPDTCKQTT